MFQAVSWFRECQKWAVLGVVVTKDVMKFLETHDAPHSFPTVCCRILLAQRHTPRTLEKIVGFAVLLFAPEADQDTGIQPGQLVMRHYFVEKIDQ